MKKYRSLQTNALLNAIKTALSILFPLITYPYAFRILHAENIGKVNNAASIESYFALVAALGFSTYAIREGAKIRENPQQFKTFASDIFTLSVCATVFSLIAEIICLLSIPYLSDYKWLILLQSLTIIFSTIGMDWINSVYEDYLFITVRTIIANIISIICLFIFVRKAEDYYIYAALTVLTQGIICISNVAYCKKYVKVSFSLSKRIKVHLMPILTLFANNIALSIYVNSDITMLGWYAGDYYVGVYSLAVKIYTVIKNMLSAIYSVTIPRLSFYIGEQNINKVKSTYSDICAQVILVLLPASSGLCCISREVVSIMGGAEYADSVLTLRILSLSLIGAILGGLVTFCLNIPLGKEKINVEATSLSALINILLNIVLIPLLKQNGAALTTLISEFFVFFYCLLRFKGISEFVEMRKVLINGGHAFLGVLSTALISFLIHSIVGYEFFSMVLIIGLSIICYAMELLLLKNSFFIEIMSKIGRRN